MSQLLKKNVAYILGSTTPKFEWFSEYEIRHLHPKGMAARILRNFEDRNIETIQDLINCPEQDFVRNRNYGQRTHKYLKLLMNKFNLKFKHEIEKSVFYERKVIDNHEYILMHSTNCKCRLSLAEGKI